MPHEDYIKILGERIDPSTLELNNTNCRLGHTEKSAIADHASNQEDGEIRFQDTQVLVQAAQYNTRL